MHIRVSANTTLFSRIQKNSTISHILWHGIFTVSCPKNLYKPVQINLLTDCEFRREGLSLQSQINVWWKGRFSLQKGKEKISMVFVSAWKPRMAVKYWPVAAVKAAKNWLFLTKERSTNNTPRVIRAPKPGATLHKSERLCREQTIASLFSAGLRFLHHPIQVIYLPIQLEEPVPAQFIFSVSARKYPHASDRNRAKRLMREAFRRNKNILYNVLHTQEAQYAVAFVYIGKTLTTFNEVEHKIQVALGTLAEHIQKKVNQQQHPHTWIYFHISLLFR